MIINSSLPQQNQKSQKLQIAYLVLNLLSPCIIAPYFLRKTHCGIITLAIFHLALIIPPMIYTHLLSPKKMKKRELFVNELKNSIYQVKAGSPLAVFFMILILIVYAGVIEFKSSLIMHLNLPLKYNVPYLLILGFNFAILNPIIEEIFWRLQMPKALEVLKQKYLKRQFVKDYKTQQQYSHDIRIFINICFGLYHWFVIEYIFGYKLATLGMFLVFILGFLLDQIRQSIGLVASIIVHMGVDFGVVLVFADLIFTALGKMNEQTAAIFTEFNFPFHLLISGKY